MKKIWLFAVLIVVISACTDHKQQKIDLIKGEEEKLFSDVTAPINLEKAQNLINQYSQFVAEYPEDTMSPVFIFKTAEIQMNTLKYKESLTTLDTLIEVYPDSKLVPMAMHLKGFIWDDKLHSVEMARICFEKLIEQYPDHQLSANAKDYLKILGLSPEEVIRRFEQDSVH